MLLLGQISRGANALDSNGNALLSWLYRVLIMLHREPIIRRIDITEKRLLSAESLGVSYYN